MSVLLSVLCILCQGCILINPVTLCIAEWSFQPPDLHLSLIVPAKVWQYMRGSSAKRNQFFCYCTECADMRNSCVFLSAHPCRMCTYSAFSFIPSCLHIVFMSLTCASLALKRGFLRQQTFFFPTFHLRDGLTNLQYLAVLLQRLRSRKPIQRSRLYWLTPAAVVAHKRGSWTSDSISAAVVRTGPGSLSSPVHVENRAEWAFLGCEASRCLILNCSYDSWDFPPHLSALLHFPENEILFWEYQRIMMTWRPVR